MATIVWSSAASSMPSNKPLNTTMIWRWVNCAGGSEAVADSIDSVAVSGALLQRVCGERGGAKHSDYHPTC